MFHTMKFQLFPSRLLLDIVKFIKRKITEIRIAGNSIWLQCLTSLLRLFENLAYKSMFIFRVVSQTSKYLVLTKVHMSANMISHQIRLPCHFELHLVNLLDRGHGFMSISSYKCKVSLYFFISTRSSSTRKFLILIFYILNILFKNCAIASILDLWC